MDLGRINLRLLRIFDMVYRERSLTAAGQRLGLSQSAVSHALGNLRAVFDDELFVRTSEGMTPTARAMRIGDRLPAALVHLENAVFGDRFDPASSTRTFSIACSDYTSVTLIPHLVARFRREAPHARLRIVPMEEKLLADVDSGKIDIIIAGLTSAPRRMEYEELFDEELVFASRPGHPLKERNVTINDVMPFGLVGVDFGLRGDTDENECFIQRGQLIQWNNTPFYRDTDAAAEKRNFDVVVPNFHSALYILKNTDMFAELPRRIADIHADELKIWTNLRSTYVSALSQLWHGSFGNQPAVIWLRQAIRNAVGDLCGTVRH